MELLSLFQSTHPRGVRPRPFCASCTCCWFQSTHPRGVRLILELLPFQLFIVSIHAPAWGATRQRLMLARTLSLLQSTHPRGVRHLSCRLMSGLSASFNPRTRVGCDFFKLY